MISVFFLSMVFPSALCNISPMLRAVGRYPRARDSRLKGPSQAVKFVCWRQASSSCPCIESHQRYRHQRSQRGIKKKRPSPQNSAAIQHI
ncbi:hypothetical protein V8F06_004406 [Rhypophila decipiens]